MSACNDHLSITNPYIFIETFPTYDLSNILLRTLPKHIEKKNHQKHIFLSLCMCMPSMVTLFYLHKHEKSNHASKSIMLKM